MIDKALSFLEKEVNNYFDARFGPSTQKWVTLGNIAKLDDGSNGNAGGNDNNSRAMLSLVNLEEDRIAKNPENFFRTPDGIAYRNPRILLNLYVLFASTSGNYSQGLQTLSFIIQCFQSNRVFEATSYPLLDPTLEKLTLDLYTLNFEQVNQLWGILGGKYMPSILYKVRVVSIEDTDRQTGGDLIREIVLTGKLLQ